jgi:NAD(P)-dependent dehydrogenase (short-subunit alcohol dehydrogenase family)
LKFGELLNSALVRPMCYLSGVTGLRDKVALITGASGGIGEAIAVEFARSGAVVVVSSRRGASEQRGGSRMMAVKRSRCAAMLPTKRVVPCRRSLGRWERADLDQQRRHRSGGKLS